jgi:hypothetical protein
VKNAVDELVRRGAFTRSKIRPDNQ